MVSSSLCTAEFETTNSDSCDEGTRFIFVKLNDTHHENGTVIDALKVILTMLEAALLSMSALNRRN